MIQPFTLYLVAALIGALAVAVFALAVFLPQAAAGRLRSESKTESELKLSSLAARVPISEIRDGLIVRRDGSFCAGWECSGVATQFADAERLEAVSAAFDAFIKGIRHPEIELQFRYLIDYETPRVLEGRKALGNCANSPAGWLEENRLSFWRSAIDAGQMRSIRLLAFVSWKPKHTWETRSAASRFAAALWQGLVQDGFGKFAKVARAALKETRTTALLQRTRTRMWWKGSPSQSSFRRRSSPRNRSTAHSAKSRRAARSWPRSRRSWPTISSCRMRRQRLCSRRRPVTWNCERASRS